MDKKIHNSKRVPSGNSRVGDFNVYEYPTKFPIDEIPTYLDEGINGICTGGSAVIDIFSNKRRIVKNDLVVVFPYQLTRITDISDDFKMLFFKVPKALFMDTLSGMCRLTPNFFFYMRRHFTFRLNEAESERFIHFCHMLKFRMGSSSSLFRRETIMHLLRVFYWDIYINFKNDPEAIKTLRYSHKEEVAFKFFCLVMEHHAENREVAFYADKLCISPKYLTMLMRDVSGRSAKDWIVEYTILEIKALLRDTDLDIKEVVSRTQFQSQSLMSRFFRKHTGLTPTQYREDAEL